MKKILLSCACCLLALGLVTACDKEEEEPNEPEVPGTVVDEGGEATYLFGFELDGVLNAIDGGLVDYEGKPQSYEGSYTSDLSKAVAISVENSGSTYYLSFDNEGVTNWITIIVNGSYTNLSYATEKSPIYLHTTDAGAEYFGNEAGDYFLCCNATFECLYASEVSSWLDSSPVAGLYTTDGKLVAGGIGETPEPLPQPVGDMKEVETGVLGVFQETFWNYYYFTGAVDSSNFGVLTTAYSEAAEVTLWQDDAYYYLTVTGDDSEVLYIGSPDTAHSRVSLTEEPYCLLIDETTGAFLTGNGARFFGTYSSYDTLSWSEVSYLGNSGQFIATLYSEEQKLVAPTEMSVTGADSVYAGFTTELGVAVNVGADPSVTWSIDLPTSETEEVEVSTYASIDESTGVVTGIAAYEGLVVTATSTLDEAISATHEISVIEIETPNIGSDPTYKLGSKDETNYVYHWFNGNATSTNQGNNFLATDTTYISGVDVYVTTLSTAAEENSYTLSFIDAESNLKYIGWSSSTNVEIQSDPYIWVWVENGGDGFFAAGSTDGRALVQYTDGTFRAYAQNATNLAYPHVTAYSSEPEAMEKPAPAYDMTLVTNLESGSEYYLAYFNDLTGEYYFFDGEKVGSNDYYLSCSTDIESAAKVTVTSADSGKWTLTFGETGSTKTLEGWLNDSSGSTHAEITYIESGSSDTHSGVTSFNWNSTHSTVTITLGETEYYLEYTLYTNNGNSTNEIQLNGISYITSTGNAFQLFTLNESEPD